MHFHAKSKWNYIEQLCWDHLDEGLLSIPAAFELVIEEQSSQLSVLMFDVVFHSGLARPAQFVCLLEVMLIDFDLFIIVVLQQWRIGFDITSRLPVTEPMAITKGTVTRNKLDMQIMGHIYLTKSRQHDRKIEVIDSRK